jgi:hypothetical protein
MLVIVCSPGHSPGVSTTALTLALTWPRQVILAECDPAGGSALTGLCLNLLPAHGLPQWAMAVGRGADPGTELASQLLPLTGSGHGHVLALPPGPAPLAVLRPHWDQLAKSLQDQRADVIADVGRIGGTDTPLPLLATADHILLLTRPSYLELAATTAALRHFSETTHVTVLLTGTGPYPDKAIRRELPVPVADLRLPHDPATASAIGTHGIYPPRLARRKLTRAVTTLAATLTGEAGHD